MNQITSPQWTRDVSQWCTPRPLNRCAAWQRTMVAMNDTVPNIAVMTHRTTGDDLKYNAAVQMVLAKISIQSTAVPQNYPNDSGLNRD